MRFSDEAVLRLIVAVVLGAVIGAERESSDQPAGLRTHIAVCLGAAVFGVISTLGFDEFETDRAATNVQIDVTRVASQVVVGIGFLGAGVIFRERSVVHNLTTAASLWVTAAIGLTAGVGDLLTAAAATGLLAAVLVALRPLRAFVRDKVRRATREIAVRLVPEADPDDILTWLRTVDEVDVDRVHYGKAEGCPTVILRLSGRPGTDLQPTVANLVGRADVTHVGTSAEVHD